MWENTPIEEQRNEEIDKEEERNEENDKEEQSKEEINKVKMILNHFELSKTLSIPWVACLQLK